MIVLRRRLLFWLLKAYVKRWGRTIILCFLLGLVGFFTLRALFSYYSPKIPLGEKSYIGIIGDYRLTTLPEEITKEISSGLTTIALDGTVQPALATSWNVEDNGKKYTFFLARNVVFSDGTKFTSAHVTYNFSDAVVQRPDPYSIVFILKDHFSPFLATAATKPVLKGGVIGVGAYKVQNVAINGNFIESLTLRSIKNKYNIKTYHFYSTPDALKMAYLLGDISAAQGLYDTSIKNTRFETFPNTKIEKEVNYEKLVTLFYNTKDSVVSDEKIRNGLSYLLPNAFPFGIHTDSPYPPTHWVYAQESAERNQDIEHAKLLLNENTDKNTQALRLTIKTLQKYKPAAEMIRDAWKQANVTTEIIVVDEIPQEYQIFLGDFFLPKDPDQYRLWHSNQDANITHYNNLRIDKLLEDGRKTVDLTTRKKIYADFQKYLLADSPATFLFFPYEYTLTRK